MTTDTELANRVVALGVGYRNLNDKKSGKFVVNNHSGQRASFLTAEQFVRDWRVAGALMEKVWAIDINALSPWSVGVERPKKPEKWFKASDGSLPRAIILACVEALDG